jgi:hypothetical protein
MGIWDDIKKAGLGRVKMNLSLQDIKDFMTDLEKDSEKPARQLVAHTGEGGIRMLNHAIEVNVYLESMKHLNFSRAERKRLGEMINSPDHENFEIAKIIINNKKKESREYHK